MPTALITHPDGLNHLTPEGHPEQVARLERVLAALDAPQFAALQRVSAPKAADDDILRVHPAAYVQTLRDSVPEAGIAALDADTYASAGTLDAVYRGAGAAVRAVDMVLSGEVRNAFCATRPPGHHAERETAMGFCLLGNVAIGAAHALDHHGLDRVAIIDFDVHHGNGTQDLLEDDARVLFVSTHQSPLYPGTGAADETGAHNNVLNLPLPPGTGSAAYRQVFTGRVLPAVREFAPQLILVSAGFDAHAADPLAQMVLTTQDFAWITAGICALADEICDGRVVSTLEGGYDLQALAEAASAHVKVLMEHSA